MKIVIQCAGAKNESAPSLCLHGNPLKFVGNPRAGALDCICPWDTIPGGNALTWIDCVRAFNNLGNSPAAVFRAMDITPIHHEDLYQCGALYSPHIYEQLLGKFGLVDVYILSAGWGLIRADRFVPNYNVTFSNAQGVPTSARVTPDERAGHPSIDEGILGTDEIHLFISQKYLAYWNLTFGPQLATRKIILHWYKPSVFSTVQVETHDCRGRKTNWHYTAAQQFLVAENR